MTGWDMVDKMASSLPPIVALVLVVAVVIVLTIGFCKHGVDFIKHGFKQTVLDESLDRRFNELGIQHATLVESLERRFEIFEKRFDELRTDIGMLNGKIEVIEVNHFGHLKNYLGVLDGILLDKNIINNQEKARLDNELRGM